MPVPLFENDEERRMAIIVAAGVALHALISSGGAMPRMAGVGPQPVNGLVDGAFIIGETFINEAERRLSQP